MATEAWRETVEQLGFSPRHRAILSGLMRGLTVDGVAYELGIRPDTVRTHIKRIYRRLRVHSRIELATVLMAEADQSGCPPSG